MVRKFEENTVVDPAERRLIEDFSAVIDAGGRDEFPQVEAMILDRLGRGLSAVAAYRLLMHARRKMLGESGPGLSTVGRDGSLTPIGPAGLT